MGINPPGDVLCDKARSGCGTCHTIKRLFEKQVERIDGVTKAWVEWIYDEGELLKVLVVEVSFDMDITVGLPCLAKPISQRQIPK
jgi:hypothetical protein